MFDRYWRVEKKNIFHGNESFVKNKNKNPTATHMGKMPSTGKGGSIFDGQERARE